MPSPRLLSALFVVTLAGGAAFVACSSSSSSGGSAQCNADPWQCPAGQTCWLADGNNNFACLNSATGTQKGDSCQNRIGSPTCGDGMVCFQQVGSPSGTCVPYCDPAKAGHGCSAGETCLHVGYSTTATFYVCVGSSPPNDSGVDTGSPPSDTGSGGDTGGVPPDGGGTD